MTVFAFQPSAQAIFQFQPTLDGEQYNAQVRWNVQAQRWYLFLYTLNQQLVFNQALVGSPTGQSVQSVSWERGKCTVTTAVPHRYPILATIDLALTGMAPAVLNGNFEAFVINPNQFTFSLADDPGIATVLGVVNYNIDLAKGYFSSSLVYREASSQFEVTP